LAGRSASRWADRRSRPPAEGGRRRRPLRSPHAPRPRVRPPAGRSLQALMAVPREEHNSAWLREALQRAIELELFPIPPYLCAMWSIKSQSGPVDNRLRGIVVEEMYHFGLACNMLNAIGGSPQVNTDGAMPKYPRSLPGDVHPGLTLGLEKLS